MLDIVSDNIAVVKTIKSAKPQFIYIPEISGFYKDIIYTSYFRLFIKLNQQLTKSCTLSAISSL